MWVSLSGAPEVPVDSARARVRRDAGDVHASPEGAAHVVSSRWRTRCPLPRAIQYAESSVFLTKYFVFREESARDDQSATSPVRGSAEPARVSRPTAAC